MKKYYAAMGIGSIVFVAVLLLTCPRETDFQNVLEEKFGIVCSNVSFSCEQKIDGKEQSLTFVDSHVRNGVFFIKVKQTFETEAGKKKEYSGIGMFGKFFAVSEKAF